MSYGNRCQLTFSNFSTFLYFWNPWKSVLLMIQLLFSYLLFLPNKKLSFKIILAKGATNICILTIFWQKVPGLLKLAPIAKIYSFWHLLPNKIFTFSLEVKWCLLRTFKAGFWMFFVGTILFVRVILLKNLKLGGKM
jgi:hypothetical protein